MAKLCHSVPSCEEGSRQGHSEPAVMPRLSFALTVLFVEVPASMLYLQTGSKSLSNGAVSRSHYASDTKESSHEIVGSPHVAKAKYASYPEEQQSAGSKCKHGKKHFTCAANEMRVNRDPSAPMDEKLWMRLLCKVVGKHPKV